MQLLREAHTPGLATTQDHSAWSGGNKEGTESALGVNNLCAEPSPSHNLWRKINYLRD